MVTEAVCESGGGGGRPGGHDPCDEGALMPPADREGMGCDYPYGGDPGLPPDPCDGPDPPAYCTNKCETGDSIIDDPAVNRVFQPLVERSNHFDQFGNAVPQDQRKETALLTYLRGDGSREAVLFVSDFDRPCSMGVLLGDVPLEYGGGRLESFTHYQPFVYGETLWTCAAEDRNQLKAPYETMISLGRKLMSEGARTYQNTPSIDDVKFMEYLSGLAGRNIIGYVIDGDKISRYDQNSQTIGAYVIPETAHKSCAVTPRTTDGLRLAGLRPK